MSLDTGHCKNERHKSCDFSSIKRISENGGLFSKLVVRCGSIHWSEGPVVENFAGPSYRHSHICLVGFLRLGKVALRQSRSTNVLSKLLVLSYRWPRCI